MSDTRIKLCGMRRPQDIAAANALRPDYIGFIFLAASHRYVDPETAMALRGMLDPAIRAVGVFVDAPVPLVAKLLEDGVIDLAQLHGHEDDAYIARLRARTDKPIIQAFKVRSAEDVARAEQSAADYILLDSGAGSGETFDWSLVAGAKRPFFLAGGLDPNNVAAAIGQVHPWAVDVSSGIETDKVKDPAKMQAFVINTRKA